MGLGTRGALSKVGTRGALSKVRLYSCVRNSFLVSPCRHDPQCLNKGAR